MVLTSFRPPTQGVLALALAALVWGGHISCRRQEAPSTPISAGLPVGHRSEPWKPSKVVLAVDVSLSMRGFFTESNVEGPGMDAFVNTMREFIGESGVEAEPFALTGTGLNPWPEDVQTEAGRFFRSLRKRQDLFNAKNNDLVGGITDLATKVKAGGRNTLGILFTDLVQSTPKEDSDATGVGQALGKAGTDVKNGGMGLGVNILRMDLPFNGLYYPESPLGPAFYLKNVRRPYYMIIISPTPDTGSRFIAEFSGLWLEKTKDHKLMGLISLTPDLVPYVKLEKYEIPVKYLKRYAWDQSQHPSWYLRLIRKSQDRNADLGIGVNWRDIPKGLMDSLNHYWFNCDIKPNQIDGYEMAPIEISAKNDEMSHMVLNVRAKTSRKKQNDSILALSVQPNGGFKKRVPGWVDLYSIDRDDVDSLRAKNDLCLPTLNLVSIVETAYRKIDEKPLIIGYIELSKER